MSRTTTRIQMWAVLPLLAAATAAAAPRFPVMQPGADVVLPYLVQAVYPAAQCAAVSDSLGLLAVANRGVLGKAGEVAIFCIDAHGNLFNPPPPPPPPPATAPATTAPATAPAATPLSAAAAPAPVAAAPTPPVPAAAPVVPSPPKPQYTITLPRPASIAAFGNAAISMAFHPTLPLLYVWQDTGGPNMGSAKENVVFKEFDHLLIYKVSAGAPPELVQAAGRGPEFFYGLNSGSIAFDAAAKRLYLPNLRLPTSADNAAMSALGFFRLDAAGLPEQVDGKPALTTENTQPWDTFPSGLGYVPISDDVIIVGNSGGPMTWDRGNRRARFNAYGLQPIAINTYRLVGHPSLPVVYLSMVGYPYVFRMEHAEGYLTLLPQLMTIAGAAVHSVPVVMAPKNKVAFGGPGRIYIADVDREGAFTGTGETATVANPSITAMAYSAKFDRLYVTVEQAPK